MKFYRYILALISVVCLIAVPSISAQVSGRFVAQDDTSPILEMHILEDRIEFILNWESPETPVLIATLNGNEQNNTLLDINPEITEEEKNAYYELYRMNYDMVADELAPEGKSTMSVIEELLALTPMQYTLIDPQARIVHVISNPEVAELNQQLEIDLRGRLLLSLAITEEGHLQYGEYLLQARDDN